MEKIRKKSRPVIDFITKLDIYGKPIMLSFDGSETYQTARGGLVTLATIGFLLYFAINSFIPVF